MLSPSALCLLCYADSLHKTEQPRSFLTIFSIQEDMIKLTAKWQKSKLKRKTERIRKVPFNCLCYTQTPRGRTAMTILLFGWNWQYSEENIYLIFHLFGQFSISQITHLKHCMLAVLSHHGLYCLNKQLWTVISNPFYCKPNTALVQRRRRYGGTQATIHWGLPSKLCMSPCNAITWTRRQDERQGKFLHSRISPPASSSFHKYWSYY